MPISESQIIFLLSGGQSNRDITKSVGGLPSTTRIDNGLNNLFEDLTQSQSVAGYVDYRCFYVKNVANQDWETVYVYMKDQPDGGAFGTLGVELNDDKQQFNIVSKNGANGGHFTVNFGSSTNLSVGYDSDIAIFANNFREALINSGECSEVSVTGKVYPNASYPPYYTNMTFQVFLIEFTGPDGHRNQPLVELNTNDLTCLPGDTINITASKLVKGAPSNTIAPEMPNTTTAPDNVLFQITTRNNPIEIGTIKVGESVPIWLRRELSPGTEQLLGDSFTVGLLGTSSIF